MKHEDPGNCLDDITSLFGYAPVTIGIGLALVSYLVWVCWRD